MTKRLAIRISPDDNVVTLVEEARAGVDQAIADDQGAGLAYALQAVKDMGKHIEVAYFENNISRDLLDIADNRHLLDQKVFKGLWSGKRPSQRRRRSIRSAVKATTKPGSKK